MIRTVRAGVMALALTALVAQPVVANAGEIRCPIPTHSNGSPLPILLVTGFFLCAGLAIGKQDADAAKGIKPVEKGDRTRAFLGCLLPFHHHKVSAVSASG